MTSRVKRVDRGKSHSYYLLTEDGKLGAKLPGVTTLIGGGLPKPALPNWAAKKAAEKAVDQWAELAKLPPSARLESIKRAPWEDRDMAAARGTEVHQLAERLLLGEEVYVPDAIAGHVESAVRFLDDYRVRPIVTETTVFSVEHAYAGTLDMVFTSDLPEHEGKVILGDWKTGRSRIYDEAALQLAAYRYAESYQGPDGDDHPVSSLGITDTWGVWIRSDGYDVFPLDTGLQTFELFRHIAVVARGALAMKDVPLVGESLPMVVPA